MHSVTAANAHSCCPLLFGAPYRNNVKTDFFSSLAFALARSIRAQYTESQPANLYWRTGEGEGEKERGREGRPEGGRVGETKGGGVYPSTGTNGTSSTVYI